MAPPPVATADGARVAILRKATHTIAQATFGAMSGDCPRLSGTVFETPKWKKDAICTRRP